MNPNCLNREVKSANRHSPNICPAAEALLSFGPWAELGKHWYSILQQAVLLFLVLLLHGCVSTPQPKPLVGVKRVVVKADASGGFFSVEGNNGAAIGAAGQGFTEVLLQRGYRVVLLENGAQVPTNISHIFHVTVNQGSEDPKGSKHYLNVEVAAMAIDANTREILWTHPARKVETSPRLGDVVRIVGELARRLAAEAPAPDVSSATVTGQTERR